MNQSSHLSTSTEEWEEALRERDDLIETLTSQLEQTVEQLDRLQRMGHDKGSPQGRGGGGGGLNGELVQRLESFLDQWEETQPHELLQQLEQRLSSTGVSVKPVSEPRGREERSSREIPLLLRESSGPSAEKTTKPEPAKPEAPKSTGGDDFWEATRARLMGLAKTESPAPVADPSPASKTQSTPPPQPTIPPTTTLANSTEAPQVTSESHNSQPGAVQPVVPPPPPPEVDFPGTLPSEVGDKASRDDLLSAIECRDEYIRYLTAKLRQLHYETHSPVDWERLANNPQELTTAVEQRALALEQRLKEADVGISLERANLGRERAKLLKIKADLERQIIKLGQLPAAPESDPNVSKADSGKPVKDKAEAENRWNRFFAREQK